MERAPLLRRPPTLTRLARFALSVPVLAGHPVSVAHRLSPLKVLAALPLERMLPHLVLSATLMLRLVNLVLELKAPVALRARVLPIRLSITLLALTAAQATRALLPVAPHLVILLQDQKVVHPGPRLPLLVLVHQAHPRPPPPESVPLLHWLAPETGAVEMPSGDNRLASEPRQACGVNNVQKDLYSSSQLRKCPNGQ